MRRRDLLARLSLTLIAVPLVGACLSEDEDDYPLRPPGSPVGGAPPGEGDGTFTGRNQDSSGHAHTVEFKCTDLEGGRQSYTAEGPHTHQLSLSSEQVDQLLDGRTVTLQTTGGGHEHTWVLRKPGAVC